MHYYSKSELAQLLGISKRTVDNWMSDGKISFTKVGRKVFFTQNDIDQLVKLNYHGATFYQQEYNETFEFFKNRKQTL